MKIKLFISKVIMKRNKINVIWIICVDKQKISTTYLLLSQKVNQETMVTKCCVIPCQGNYTNDKQTFLNYTKGSERKKALVVCYPKR